MMTTVFQKMEAYSGNFGVDIQTIQRNLDAKFNSRKKQATRLQKDFGVTELAVSSFFNDEEDSLERSREEPERVGTQINFSAMDQYLYMLCQNMVDNVCIYHKRKDTLEEQIEYYSNADVKDGDKNKELLDDLMDKLENLSLRIVPKHKQKAKPSYIPVELPNEKGIESGKFGWCLICRKEANLYCKDTYYPICSLDCKQRLLNLIDSIEVERNSSVPQVYNNDEMKRHFTDAILLFKSICKLFLKDDATNMNTYSLKSQIMGLELILNVVEKPGATFLTRPEFINIIKSHLCKGLLKHCVSNEKTIFALSISIFYALFVHFREHLKLEILVLIEEIFLKVLNSGNSNYHHKYLILRVFDKIAKNTKHLIEIFVNYDCDVESKDILEKMIDTLSKIAQGKFSKTEHANMLTEKEEHSLKLYALKILASVVKRLNQFLSEEQKDAREESKQQNSGGFKNEIDDDEEQSPHYLQQLSMTDTSMADPKKDNYEKNRLLKSNINKAASKFNLKPKNGIKYLLEFNNAKDLPYDQKLELIVNFLKTTPTLDKTAIGDYLGEDIEMNKDVLYKLIDCMEFQGKPFVPALKILLQGFRLPGEGQKVDRIMEKFGEKYVKDNPETFGNSECIYLLSYATMMLQTSIHNPSARNHAMTLEDFKKMTKGINDGKDIEERFLEEVYQTIEKDPITLVEDDEARIKVEGSSATSYKRKQEIFIKEGQGLAKRGQDLMQEKRKTTQFILVNDSDAIGPLFESCWSAMFAVFSVLLEEQEDQKILNLCIDGFLNSIKICGFYCMDTERDAFVSSLVNFTGIYKVADNDSLLKKELTPKNIICTLAILQLAMHEGNYLANSWKNILKVMSMINYYHTIGSGAKGYAELFLEHEDSHYKDPEMEIIKAHNAAHILTAIDESEIDKIFSNSTNLGPIAIVDLIRCMCVVSNEELHKQEGPRIFLLQKIVEVADLNMNRARIEFSNMWKEMKDHISNVGSHKNERIAEYAIDSLRQLAKKFLEKEELNNYHFQKDFLEPFNVIMLHNMPARMNIIHFIMSCMCLFARQKTSNIKSGWEIIIEIFKFGGENDSFELSQEAIFTLREILQPKSFVYVEEYFEKVVNCLVKFINNRFEEHALIALNLMENVADYLGENKNLVNRIIDKSRIVFSSKQEKTLYKKSLWKSILYELSKKAFETKNKVTETAHQLMFKLLTKYNEKMNDELWELVFSDLLKAMFDDLNIKLETKSNDEDMIDMYLNNTRIVIQNLVELVNCMEKDKFELSVKILLRVFRNFSINYQHSPVSTEMLRGMQLMVQKCEDRFDRVLCKEFVHVICELFNNKDDKSLFEESKNPIIEESKSGHTKLNKIYETQGHRLLGLIKNSQEIAIKYDVLETEDINELLSKLEYVYDVVHKFNLNIKRRFELYTTINLKASYDCVPVLLKHEIEVLGVYYTFLSNLYSQPKEDVNKADVTGKIIDFSIKVLKGFSENYNKMLHIPSKHKEAPITEYGNVDIKEVMEEMKRILVSISVTVSKNVLRTLTRMEKADLKEHVKVLTPLLIDCTVCDQLEFNLRLKDVLKKMFKMLTEDNE